MKTLIEDYKEERIKELSANYTKACTRLKESVERGKLTKANMFEIEFKYLKNYRELSHLFSVTRSKKTLTARGIFE
jgi:hypothetical protein